MASSLPIDVMTMVFHMETDITPEKIANVKLNLMSRDTPRMISAVSWIKQNLDSASDARRESLINVLIENDVLTFFCEKIACSHGYLFTMMLEILHKLIPNRNFYATKLAKLSSEAIIRASHILTKKMKLFEETLSIVAFTLYSLLDGASRARVSLDQVYYPDQMIAFLEMLDPKRSSSVKLRFSAAKLLCLIMPNVKFPIREETKSSLFNAFKDSLLVMGRIALDFGDGNWNEALQSSIEILCSSCAIGTRFCKELEGYDLATEITCSMIDTVIPQFKRIKFERGLYQKSLQNLINCLDEIFKLQNSSKELANVLAVRGYLKYFLEIPVPRKSVSSLVSQIIAKLSEDDFAQSDSPEVLAEFQNNIKKEILELPSDADISTILQTKQAVSDAFLILLYFHSHKTYEYDLVPLSTMILKLISIAVITEVKFDLILKASWFLFMVSSTKGSQVDYLLFYPDAVKNLAQLLQNHDLRKCYTHNRALLDCSLNCEGFPVQLQYETVRLWLDFNGDIETILESPKTELIDYCLVDTIETSSEKLVNRALEALAKLKSNRQRWTRICVRVWERLPKVLALCGVNTAMNVKELLKIALGTKPREINLEIHKEAAASLAKVLANEELDAELKILFLQYVNKLLQLARERKSSTVAETCVKHAQMFTILRDKGLDRENFILSGFCIDLMVNILESQRDFEVQSSESDIVKIEPLKILVLLARSNYRLSLAAVRLLTVLLTEKEKIMVVGLVDFENDEAADEATSAWYKQVHQLLPQKRMDDWHLIYRCLISVLCFCKKIELHKTLQYLCDYPSTYDILRWTMDHEYANPFFFAFVETWLNYAFQYQSANVVLATGPRFEHLRIGPTEFEEIIELINDFREKVNKSRVNI